MEDRSENFNELFRHSSMKYGQCIAFPIKLNQYLLTTCSIGYYNIEIVFFFNCKQFNYFFLEYRAWNFYSLICVCSIMHESHELSSHTQTLATISN